MGRASGEHLFDLAEELLACEGLFEEAVVIFAVAAHVAAGAKDADVRREVAEAFDDFAAAHLGHDHVGDDEADLIGTFAEGFEGFLAAVGGEDAVAVAGEDHLAHVEN